MRRLYFQIVGAVVLSVAVGWGAVALVTPLLRDIMEQGLANQVVGSGLGAVATRIEAQPEAEWPRILNDARQDITLPIAVATKKEVPSGVAKLKNRPGVARSDGDARASVYIPLKGGSHFLVAGPLQPPPLAPLVITFGIFTVVLAFTASVLVGMPLVRRLRTFREALIDVGGGNWGRRLDANAEGALSELADSLNRMAADLQRQFQERESLLQTVSHEIGTPLSRMRFQLEMLEQAGLSREQRTRLTALGEDLNELDELSSELVSWMETAASPYPRTDFEVRAVLEPLIEIECRRIGRPIQTVLDLPDHPVQLRADQRQFQRVVENLLRNAVRYASGYVVIHVQEGADSVVLEVRDDGPGIPPDQRTHVLQPFVRIDGQASGEHRGLGLGLAIVRRILEGHGGSVTVGEAPEGGAALRTVWPRAPRT